MESINQKTVNRFWSRVDKSGECWQWTGSKRGIGYGQFAVKINKGKYKNVATHRFVLELQGIEIPPGLYVCHHCDNPSCVNPDHLFIGTAQDNEDDKTQKGRQPKGNSHHASKLCDLDVWLIRELLQTKTQTQIANWFGITQATVSLIHLRLTWQ